MTDLVVYEIKRIGGRLLRGAIVGVFIALPIGYWIAFGG